MGNTEESNDYIYFLKHQFSKDLIKLITKKDIRKSANEQLELEEDEPCPSDSVNKFKLPKDNVKASRWNLDNRKTRESPNVFWDHNSGSKINIDNARKTNPNTKRLETPNPANTRQLLGNQRLCQEQLGKLLRFITWNIRVLPRQPGFEAPQPQRKKCTQVCLTFCIPAAPLGLFAHL